ncbi:MAG: hypothetical protein IIZ09_14040 [Ruminococcus sp.]|nr:hypothetical protein [Ruminococcus sp.]
MTTEEVKTYLRQAYKLDKRLQREQMKLEKLRTSIEYRSPAFDGMGGHGSGDRLSEAVASIVERSERVDELAAEYAKKYEEVEKCIREVEDDALEEVLELRYLQYMKWEEIANAMHYTERRVLQLHGLALHKISLYFSI